MRGVVVVACACVGVCVHACVRWICGLRDSQLPIQPLGTREELPLPMRAIT